jgi:hypothetical protein
MEKDQIFHDRRVFTPALPNSPEGTPKKSCNDDMILFIFHMNEDPTFSDFRKMAGRPLYSAVKCRYKTFFSAPPELTEIFLQLQGLFEL